MDKPSLLHAETSDSHRGSGGNQKGDLGLLTLNQPSASCPVAADIIFIHGLGGGSRKTWSYSSDPGHFWPQSWLSKDPDFANVRIHTFGYAADWADSQRSVLGISDFAHSLLGEISNHSDIRRATTGIILCGHSLGGCVAKKAYIHARHDPSRADLASRIRSIIFLGTPHRGSNLAGILNKVLSATATKKPFVPSLKRGSSELVDINDAFRNIQTPLRLWSFYETLPTKTFAFFRSIVVEKDSATLGYPGEEIAALAADHRQLCKFRSPDDPNYKTIRNAMLTAVDAIRSAQPELNLAEKKRGTADNDARLRHFLQIQSMPEDDFEALRVLKQPGSCEWLTHREGFFNWLAGGEDVPNIFWLMANPGAGKSVLSVHVLDTVGESDSVTCSGSSFQGSKSRNSAISECLRSLAYQMARADTGVLSKVLHLEEEGLTWNPLDESAVWRNLFVSNIFDVPSISRHVWVIDGLDECVDFQAIFAKKLLLNVSPKLRIFMTSRPLEAIERGMRSLGPKVSRYGLEKDDTAEDMTRVVMTKLRELGIPEDEEDRLCRAILGRSSGMFLWVWLVLREFESDTIWTTEDMYSALNEIPSDLTDLYIKNLGPVLKDKRALKLAKPILSWVILGSRMLTTQEIRCIQETLKRIERAIPTICAQLLSVDKSNRVHIVHETFREFLLSEESPPALDIHKTQSNSRIAMLLLRYLTGDHMQPVIRGDSTFTLRGIESRADLALVDYAARYFSDHLSGGDALDNELLDSLVRFLESDKVLSWIALAAKDGDMLRLSKVATHLQQYVDKRLESLGPNAVEPRCNLDGDVVVISTRSSSGAVLRSMKMAVFQPIRTTTGDEYSQNLLNGICALVTNTEGSRAVWEYIIYDDPDDEDLARHALVVADLTPSLAQWDMSQALWDVTIGEKKGPACKVILEQIVPSGGVRLLLNKSGDRLLREIVGGFDLWELPSGRRLATQTFQECWGRGSRNIGAFPRTDVISLKPLITQHPTEPEWLVCVDVTMHEPVMLVSWGDLKPRPYLDHKALEDTADEEAGEPHRLDQPTPPGLFAILLHGLETVMPNPDTYDLGLIWDAWLHQYIALCATIDTCAVPVAKALWATNLKPIAFFASTRTLIFKARNDWIYSTDMLQHFPHADNGDPYLPISQSPLTVRGRDSKGGEGLSCQECGGHHRVQAKRHFLSSFLSIGHGYSIFWTYGTLTPDGRQTLDFIIWSESAKANVVVKDGLRYGEEVELVERKDKDGNVFMREWERVEVDSWSVNPRMEGSA
ncbi:uncharacterized protein DNG_00198 [Cephalotrichum gorgonifer]|uniref:GPI inositol-deacylase n=1 Tax=Cephalotrichum gorgonifer TaxID=2041049 RepID=A0AAE8SQJ6_9PEZI|nr:uncharacterized protein DNG_00198 [Cephalotrichum gorgonifer]